MWFTVRGDSFDWKLCTDLGAGVDEEATVRRPRRIYRILRDHWSDGSVDGDPGDSRPGALVHCDRDRLPVRRPGRSTMDFKRRGQHAGAARVIIHDVEIRAAILLHNGGDAATVRGDRERQNTAIGSGPQFLHSTVRLQLPDPVRSTSR